MLRRERPWTSPSLSVKTRRIKLFAWDRVGELHNLRLLAARLHNTQAKVQRKNAVQDY
jgi:hypothetical protein